MRPTSDRLPSAEVREAVRDTLLRVPSFEALSAPDRRRLAHDLVQVLEYLSDPAAGLDGVPLTAEALEERKDAVEKFKDKLSAEDKGFAGSDFEAGAVREGTDAFKDLVDSVDFPKFVSGLIEGVFTSIVNSSIRQMHEFGKFLEGVAKSLHEFAQDNVDDQASRQWVASRYPKAMRIDGQSGRLTMNDDVDDKDRPDFSALGIDGEVDVSDEEEEKKLVESARLKVARMRQQQLATMVMLGINRIVVTEGEIKASVNFDVKMSDTARRQSARGMGDTQTGVHASSKSSGGGWGSMFGGDESSESSVQTRVSTAHTNTRDDSDSKVEAKANLSGYVRVKFKSETFPLEKLANPMEMGSVNEKAAR